jgi:hypothetical protein
MVINPGHGLYDAFGGIHHLYANKAAMAGYKTGKWADGAVIVFDLLEAKSADNAVVEGSRKVVGVMHRDARKYAATGGWGYEGFKGDSSTERAVGANALTACHQCHIAEKWCWSMRFRCCARPASCRPVRRRCACGSAINKAGRTATSR